MITFTLKMLVSNPLIASTYGVLIFGTLAMWIYHRWWLWSPLILASVVLAFFADVIDARALIPIGFLLACHLCLHMDIKGPMRIFLIAIAALISLGLAMHLMPGFNNWLLADNVQLSPEAHPLTLYWNFDKPFIGLFVLGFNLPLLTKWAEWKPKFKLIVLWAIITVCTMILLAYALGMVHVDIKLPSITLFWLLGNFFLVCVPAEAFWRGFLQRELTDFLRLKTEYAAASAIAIVASAFAILHVFFVPDVAYIFLALCAGILYGMTYHFTRCIEAAIIVHFLLNATQFFFFTYPALN